MSSRPATLQPQARLLIVDDEAAHTRALCETLGTLGYQTTGCTSAAAALAALESSTFDLLLTDLNMPGMNGISLLRTVQARHPSMIGIIMTGEGSISSAVEAMQSGALDYILKPFKLSAALPVLARALKVRALRLDNANLQAQVGRHVEELRTANRDLESFSYSVSHDLRGPLQAIDGFSHMLMSRHAGQLDEKGLHYLRRVRASVGQMNQLVEGLMRLSHVVRQPLVRKPVNVTCLVSSVIDELRQEQMLKGATVIVAQALPPALADVVLLRQVFKNLLSNAAKFSANRTPQRIEVGSAERDGEPAYFVRDNGAGFDAAQARRLFEPFQRFHRPEEFAGTGVGLSIVYRVVVRHEGRISAESAVGEGACFYFSLGSGNGETGDGGDANASALPEAGSLSGTLPC